MMTESAVRRCVRELVANLDRETALYEKLAGTAREAALAAERCDPEALCELLRTKSAVIAELRPVAETTEVLRGELANHQVPQEFQERASEALQRARSALEALLNLEQANEESFRAMTDSVRAELVETVRGRRLLEGYRVKRGTDPMFMDKRR